MMPGALADAAVGEDLAVVGEFEFALARVDT